MAVFLTRGGAPWTPAYLLSIDQTKCIGCGRCFKVCSRAVMSLKGVTEDDELVDADPDGDDDEEFLRKVMVVADAGNCIGCGACARVCPKGCQRHGEG
ncbi:ferredoxin III, nif-specific [Rhodocista pekingensis]|uniref:Ferredoxin III n=1 Tax=Rhodocista pekingensis TaxID=201185 RepID=A0ABW2KR38_9PROT